MNSRLLGLKVIKPGMHTLIQDLGRHGVAQIGLTEGGPMDPWAFIIANRLCRNIDNSSTLEISFGGLQLQAISPVKIALTGAPMPLSLNGISQPLWQSFDVNAGDIISIGFSNHGMRSYLAVRGGFNIIPQFGSTSTVCREGIGGLEGKPLSKGDILPTYLDKQDNRKPNKNLRLALRDQPTYPSKLTIRTILGYQYKQFSAEQVHQFFNCTYQVSSLSDRMGYRLQGRALTTNITGILSEGICYGAIQIPADGQPIIMLNDRQTIGGYPKLGSILKVDGARLAQLKQGDSVQFKAITWQDAITINQDEARSFLTISFESI